MVRSVAMERKTRVNALMERKTRVNALMERKTRVNALTARVANHGDGKRSD